MEISRNVGEESIKAQVVLFVLKSHRESRRGIVMKMSLYFLLLMLLTVYAQNDTTPSHQCTGEHEGWVDCYAPGCRTCNPRIVCRPRCIKIPGNGTCICDYGYRRNLEGKCIPC